MKLRIMRGPNCWDARVRARMVIEKTTPITVMTAAAMAMSTWRPASALPVRNQNGKRELVMVGGEVDREGGHEEHQRDDRPRMQGTSQKVVRSASSRQPGSLRRVGAMTGVTWTGTSLG